ncbi:MAG TPA: response regulator, partial [Burkholderiales bacterium]|nr:response regulator [Burkholderiales bacterium]
MSSAKHRVLVCEDDKMTAELWKVTVESAGHEVLVCYDGREAIDKVGDWQPTVGIIDIGLPYVTGYG